MHCAPLNIASSDVLIREALARGFVPKGTSRLRGGFDLTGSAMPSHPRGVLRIPHAVRHASSCTSSIEVTLRPTINCPCGVSNNESTRAIANGSIRTSSSARAWHEQPASREAKTAASAESLALAACVARLRDELVRDELASDSARALQPACAKRASRVTTTNARPSAPSAHSARSTMIPSKRARHCSARSSVCSNSSTSAFASRVCAALSVPSRASRRVSRAMLELIPG